MHTDIAELIARLPATGRADVADALQATLHRSVDHATCWARQDALIRTLLAGRASLPTDVRKWVLIAAGRLRRSGPIDPRASVPELLAALDRRGEPYEVFSSGGEPPAILWLEERVRFLGGGSCHFGAASVVEQRQVATLAESAAAVELVCGRHADPDALVDVTWDEGWAPLVRVRARALQQGALPFVEESLSDLWAICLADRWVLQVWHEGEVWWARFP